MDGLIEFFLRDAEALLPVRDLVWLAQVNAGFAAIISLINGFDAAHLSSSFSPRTSFLYQPKKLPVVAVQGLVVEAK
jgi:hypothetical protein